MYLCRGGSSQVQIARWRSFRSKLQPRKCQEIIGQRRVASLQFDRTEDDIAIGAGKDGKVRARFKVIADPNRLRYYNLPFD